MAGQINETDQSQWLTLHLNNGYATLFHHIISEDNEGFHFNFRSLFFFCVLVLLLLLWLMGARAHVVHYNRYHRHITCAHFISTREMDGLAHNHTRQYNRYDMYKCDIESKIHYCYMIK